MNTAILQRLGDALAIRKSYRSAFTSEDGQRVLRHLCKNGCVTSPAFVAGDPTTTAYNNGKRDIVLAILRYVHASDDDIRRAIEETYKQTNQPNE